MKCRGPERSVPCSWKMKNAPASFGILSSAIFQNHALYTTPHCLKTKPKRNTTNIEKS